MAAFRRKMGSKWLKPYVMSYIRCQNQNVKIYMSNGSNKIQIHMICSYNHLYSYYIHIIYYIIYYTLYSPILYKKPQPRAPRLAQKLGITPEKLENRPSLRRISWISSGNWMPGLSINHDLRKHPER